jgi:hypothetical protein
LAADTAAWPKWERKPLEMFGCINEFSITTLEELQSQTRTKKSRKLSLQLELLQLSSGVFSAHCNPSHINVEHSHVCPQISIISNRREYINQYVDLISNPSI